MKNSRLRALLQGLDKKALLTDCFENLNETVAVNLRSKSGGVNGNGTCPQGSNTGCYDNESCSGNNGCHGNSVCDASCNS
jgi:hypothetical protein